MGHRRLPPPLPHLPHLPQQRHRRGQLQHQFLRAEPRRHERPLPDLRLVVRLPQPRQLRLERRPLRLPAPQGPVRQPLDQGNQADGRRPLRRRHLLQGRLLRRRNEVRRQHRLRRHRRQSRHRPARHRRRQRLGRRRLFLDGILAGLHPPGRAARVGQHDHPGLRRRLRRPRLPRPHRRRRLDLPGDGLRLPLLPQVGRSARQRQEHRQVLSQHPGRPRNPRLRAEVLGLGPHHRGRQLVRNRRTEARPRRPLAHRGPA